MQQGWIVLLGAIAGGVMTFLVQMLTVRRQRRYDVMDRIRSERLQATAELPAALVEYRHAQISRRADQLRTGGASPQFSSQVRTARGAAWSAVYRFELLVDDEILRQSAYELMNQIKQLKTIDDLARLDELGTEVHWSIQAFVKLARGRLAFV